MGDVAAVPTTARARDREALLLPFGEPLLADEGAPRAITLSPLHAFPQKVARPPLRDRRFWYAQGLVALVLLVHLGADLAQDAQLIPVPGFVWLLGLFLPVIYAGTVFGFAGSLATALEGALVVVPCELLDSHGALARWATFSTLVMVCSCALLLGEQFERNRVQQERLRAEERAHIAAAALAEAGRREQEQAAAASKVLAASEQRFRLMFTSNMSGIVLVDAEDRLLEANPAFCRLVGYREEELVGGSAHGFTCLKDRERGDKIHARLLSGELDQATYTKRYRHKDGHVVRASIQKSAARDETGTVAYFVCSVQDVTSQHHLTTQLNHQARHDPLTGLANRRLIEERLPRALDRARTGESLVALMLLDLDNFKGVNDALGHNAGDEVLVEVARRLGRASRRGDTLARLGGDEFLYLAEGLGSGEDARRLAERLLATLVEPILVSDKRVEQRASLGIALAGTDVTRGEQEEPAQVVLRNADIALYEAKRQGKGCPVLFSWGMRERVASRFEHSQALGRALACGELSMHYQPIVNLATGAPVGFEALMRWERPGEGFISPSTFIPLAERSDLILELGGFALREAVSEAARWPRAGIDGVPLRVAVNVSPRQLFAPQFVSEVGDLLAVVGFPPEQLVLEVTEGSLLGDVQRATRILEDLATCGVGVAIDDFGTGHSSLSRLAELRPSILKIDRSFVSPARARASTEAMVETMVALGRRLGMAVIAEGIETSAQRDRLLELGCQLGQGFFFSPALPADELAGILGAPAVPARGG